MLIGSNYWYWSSPLKDHDLDPGVDSKMRASGISLVRIGGARADMYPPSDTNLQTMVARIRDNMKAEPLIQVPRSGYFNSGVAHYGDDITGSYRDLPVTRTRDITDAIAIAKRWVEMFNGPGKLRPVRYWSIGNELRMQDNRSGDAAEISRKIHEYFLPIAAAMKEVDPNIKIFGPDEAWLDDNEHKYLFWTGSDAGFPNTYNISGKVPGKSYYYCDGLSIHMYSYDLGGVFSAAATEADLLTQFNQYQGNYTKAGNLVANHPRNKTNDPRDRLEWGLGEFNVGIQPGQDTSGTFVAGQLFADTFAWAASKGATYATGWSISEGGFGLFNSDASKTPKPSYWHTKLMAQNFTGRTVDIALSTPDGSSLINRETNGNPPWRAHANVDAAAKKVALVILNHGPAIPSVTVYDKRNTSVTSGARIGIDFISAVTGGQTVSRTCDIGNIPAKATVMIVFSGSTISKTIYEYVAPSATSAGPSTPTTPAGTNPWPTSAYPALIADVNQLSIFAGGQATFNLWLSSQPSATLPATWTQNPSLLTLSPTTWSFGTSNWDTLKLITVSAPPNAIAGTKLTLVVQAGSSSITIPVTIQTRPTVSVPTPAAPTADNPSSATPTLSGSAVAGSTITIFDGTTVLGTTTADASGKWSWTVNPGLSPGVHVLTVTAQDQSKASSQPSDPVTVTVPGSTTPSATSGGGSSGGGCGAGSGIALLIAAMLLAAARNRWCARSER